MPDPGLHLALGWCRHRALPNPALSDLHGKPTRDLKSTSTLFELEPVANGAWQFLTWIDKQWRHRDFLHYRQHHQQRICDLLGPMLPVGSAGLLQSPKWKAGPKHEDFIRDMFRRVDICFFFGTLSTPYGGRRSPLVELVIDDKRGGGMYENGARNGVTRDITHLHQQIILYPYPWIHNDEARYLHLIIETLIHEMIHAYGNIFLCRQGRCSLARDSTRGRTGHGVFFMLLQARITSTIRSWDPRLRTFLLDTKFDALVHSWDLQLELNARGGQYNIPRWAAKVVGFQVEVEYLKDLVRRMTEYEAEEKRISAQKKRKRELVEEASAQFGKGKGTEAAVAVARPSRKRQKKTNSAASHGTGSLESKFAEREIA